MPDEKETKLNEKTNSTIGSDSESDIELDEIGDIEVKTVDLGKKRPLSTEKSNSKIEPAAKKQKLWNYRILD